MKGLWVAFAVLSPFHEHIFCEGAPLYQVQIDDAYLINRTVHLFPSLQHEYK